MPDIVVDGRLRVWWVPAVASVNGPTIAEITAGTELSPWIPRGGFNHQVTQAEVDASSINSPVDAKRVGTRGDSVEVTFKHQGANKTVAPWTLFPNNPDGFLVYREGAPASQALASGDRVTVLGVQAGNRQPVQGTQNEMWKFTVAFMIRDGLLVSDTAVVA